MLPRLLFVIAKPRNDLNVHQPGVLDKTLWFINTTGCSTAATRTCSCLPQHRCIPKACPGCLVMSDSFRPHGLQPARLLCPWEKSSKNTGMSIPFPTPGDLPNPRIKLVSSVSPALAGRFFTTAPPGKPQNMPWKKRRQVRQDTYHKYKCMLYIMGTSIHF